MLSHHLGKEVRCPSCQRSSTAKEAPPAMPAAKDAKPSFWKLDKGQMIGVGALFFVVVAVLISVFQNDGSGREYKSEEERAEEVRELRERQWERDAERARRIRELEEQRKFHLLKEEIKRRDGNGEW